MAVRYSEQDIKTDIGNMSQKHRIGVLHWLNKNISNKDLIEHYSTNDSAELFNKMTVEGTSRAKD